MAAPAVTGAVALYKASRPNATPAEVKEALQYLGNLDWKTSTDPDTHPREAARRVAARAARVRSRSAPAPAAVDRRGRRRRSTSRSRWPAARRSSSGSRSRSRRCPTGWTAALGVDQPHGLDRRTRPRCDVTVPQRHARRDVRRRRSPARTRAGPRRRPSRSTSIDDNPTAKRAGHAAVVTAARIGSTTVAGPRSRGRPPPTRPARSPATRSQSARRRRRVGRDDRRRPEASRSIDRTAVDRRDATIPGPRAGRRRQLEPVGRGRRADPASTSSTTAARRSPTAARGRGRRSSSAVERDRSTRVERRARRSDA